MKYFCAAALLVAFALRAEDTPQPVETPEAKAVTVSARAEKTEASSVSASARSTDSSGGYGGFGRSSRSYRRDSQSSVSAAADAPGFEKFLILSQRNIFSKSRGRREERPRSYYTRTEPEDTFVGPPAPPKPTTEIVLIGILEKDGQAAAFLENRTAGTTQIVKRGDAVGRGKAGLVTLNHFEYVVDGATTLIEIGKTLDGGEPGTSAPISSSTSTTSNSSDANSILERLRKKRQEEMLK